MSLVLILGISNRKHFKQWLSKICICFKMDNKANFFFFFLYLNCKFCIYIRLYLLIFILEDWDREKLLEAWMSNPENCCQRSGVQMPTPPPSGYNAWDTLPSPRTPRTTRSSVTSPDEISPSPGDIETAVVSL